MTIERRLQIAMAAVACLGTSLLGIGQGNTTLPVLAIVVAATSVYFTDVKGWLVLNTTWANVAGLAAMAVTLWNFRVVSREVLFLSLADLLVYLQCILLYRRKVARVYWMLALLSLLQVAVGSVLTLSYIFGLLLIVYLFTMLTALSLFLIHRQQSEFQRANGASGASTRRLSPWELLFSLPLDELLKRLVSGGRPAAGSNNQDVPRRWPLARDGGAFSPRRAKGPDDSRLTCGLRRRVLLMGAVTLVLAPLLFALVPRGDARRGWYPGGSSSVSLVGFTEDVALDEVGDIIESPEEVMRIQFFEFKDGKKGRPYKIAGDLWFRGTALARYEDGRWRKETWSRHEPIPLTPLHPAGAAGREVVLQEITTEPMNNTQSLFVVSPSFGLPGPPPDIREDPSVVQLLRPRAARSKAFRCSLLTLGLQGGRQLPFRPVRAFGRGDQHRELLLPFIGLRDFVRRGMNAELMRRRQRLQGLEQLAREVVSALPADKRWRRRDQCLALERHLRDSGHFTYTLHPPRRDTGFDPIEDFIVNHPQGHCEYFASALTLMLRSQGVPARMVVGYKGADFNEIGEFHQVRQYHAHAWVEAWLNDAQGSGWLRLDPTPAAREEIAAPFGRASQITNYLEYLWAHYVLGMNSTVQRQSVYRPLSEGAGGLFDAHAWRQWWNDLKQGIASGDLSAGHWFNWRVAVLAIVAQLLLVAVCKLFRLWRRLRSTSHSGEQQRRGGPLLEFYRRLEAMCFLLGLVRTPGQTPREFATLLAARLNLDSETRYLSSTPDEVVAAYYQVRFGHRELDEEELQAVESALDALESAVQSVRGA